MPHMVPDYTQEAFVTVTKRNGESESVPADFYCEDDFPDRKDVDVYEGKYWARLSAPGYMDQTEWSGPYDTLQEAKDYIESTYDVDPDTGEDL